jgi:hypothetical protein
MNLYLFLFWLVLGGALLLWPLVDANARVPALRGTSIPVGWLALALALYNLARWWAIRSQRAQPRARDQAGRRPTRVRNGAGSQSPPPPDPTFDFSDPPADRPG